MIIKFDRPFVDIAIERILNDKCIICGSLNPYGSHYHYWDLTINSPSWKEPIRKHWPKITPYKHIYCCLNCHRKDPNSILRRIIQ